MSELARQIRLIEIDQELVEHRESIRVLVNERSSLETIEETEARRAELVGRFGKILIVE